MTGPRPSGRMRPSLRALPPRCFPSPEEFPFREQGSAEKRRSRRPFRSASLPKGRREIPASFRAANRPGSASGDGSARGKAVRGGRRTLRQAPRRTEERSAALNAVPSRSSSPRPLPTAPDRFRPGGFGARCGEKEAAAELQRAPQRRVPSGADSVIRPPGIPFSDIPGTDRTGNGHGPAV